MGIAEGKKDRVMSKILSKGGEKMFIRIVVFFTMLFWSGLAFGAHPLITDDAGTLGRGKFQLELNGKYDHTDKDGVTEKTTEMATALGYGVTNNMDIVLGIPYQHTRTEDTDAANTEDGISDASIDLKWRFYERDGFGIALKPGITLPTGDDQKGLGAGRVTYGVFFINTKEIGAWAFHLNLGYKRNENKVDEEKDIWHASIASEVEVARDIKAVVNIGTERNTDKTSDTNPAFILGGLIYSISENFDVVFGVKGGLHKTEPDYSILAGITLRF